MNLHPADAAEPTGAEDTADTVPFGLHRFCAEPDLSFQANRFGELIGRHSIPEIRAALGHGHITPERWTEAFLGLAEAAREEGRPVDAALYDRAAEFLIQPGDPRKQVVRRRYVAALHEAFGVSPVQVPYTPWPQASRGDHGSAHLHAYDLRPQGQPSSTWVVFGGFDSCVEELLPYLATVAARGRRVVAFDGPGQGSVLEEQGIPMTPQWHRPVGAVLDHFGLDDVTLLGFSLGGALVIRAAAHEPRARRVVAWNAMDDFLEVSLNVAMPPSVRAAVRAAVPRLPRRPLNALLRRLAASDQTLAWGLWQGMHVTGASSPADFLRATARLHTRDVSSQVTADVLLLQGTQDHYVPNTQMHRQARALTRARSVTTRSFTPADQAASHCQVGNTGLALRTILAWENSLG